MFLILLLVGAFGFVAMTLLGFGHGASGHHGAGHLSGTHGGASSLLHRGAGSLLHRGAARGARAPVAKGQYGGVGADPWQLLMLLSPLDFFSLLVGAGAVGTLCKGFLSGSPLNLAAGLGGVVFAFGIIRPLMGLMMRFAGRPSEGLEGEVASVGHAITGFDSSGQGLIQLVLDEQNVQLLARLEPSERERGVWVRKGDSVVIISVDPAKNTCLVSREFAPTSDDHPTPASKRQEAEIIR